MGPAIAASCRTCAAMCTMCVNWQTLKSLVSRSTSLMSPSTARGQQAQHVHHGSEGSCFSLFYALGLLHPAWDPGVKQFAAQCIRGQLSAHPMQLLHLSAGHEMSSGAPTCVHPRALSIELPRPLERDRIVVNKVVNAQNH